MCSSDLKLELSEALAKQFGDMKDDPVLPLWRETAHELGLSQQQFNEAFEKLYARMAEKGLLETPADVGKQVEALMPVAGDLKQRTAAAHERVNKAIDFVEGLANRGLPKEQAARLAQIAETADGVKALEHVAKLLAAKGLQGGGEPGGSDGLSPNERALRQLYPSMFKS